MATEPPPLPDIPGLDTVALDERMQGDPALVRAVLGHFAATQRAAADRLPELVQHDLPGALHRSHDLKGMLGNLGADALYTQAAQLCELLRDEPPDVRAALAPALQLQRALPRLCDEIAAALGPEAPPTDGVAAPLPPVEQGAAAGHRAAGHQAQDPSAFTTALTRLAEPLRRSRAREAKQALAALSACAASADQQTLVADLTPLVTGYRLRDALRVLEQNCHG
ncbi:Hpt domain-containing protein [uncultured Thiohalocapsa sp.]|uniref:Hpt domain-containing protein n=1 Tax=uncultured Thiohalocapsa sp. TaxID=768990 RepID=UPI0025F9003A|nr:Hpt domain-containing protein [uncultured Thiohalocapsa sp.]